MMRRFVQCPRCGAKIKEYKNPLPTVDIIIEMGSGDAVGEIILIRRKNEPHGWAIPGGFVDYGESLEDAAVREAREETGLDVRLMRQFHTYSDPKRDPRFHAISTVYIAKAQGIPQAKDDAQEVGIFRRDTLPENIVFDHRRILEDYFRERRGRGKMN
jgi:ADP-ribose pyrophosphatase YjhB (NUDIX family)